MKKFLVKNNEIEKIEILKTIQDAPKYKYEDGWRDEVYPDCNYELQRLGKIYFDAELDAVTYQVVDIPQKELDSQKQQKLEALDNQFDQQAAKRLLQKIAEPIMQDETNLSEQDIEDVKMLYKQYRVGIIYDKDSANIDEKRFVWENDLYKVIGTRHTSQADWKPNEAVSLYVKVTPPGQAVPWNAADYASYEMGTQVTHNGINYECINPTYAWIEPGTQDGHYGWVVV